MNLSLIAELVKLHSCPWLDLNHRIFGSVLDDLHEPRERAGNVTQKSYAHYYSNYHAHGHGRVVPSIVQ